MIAGVVGPKLCFCKGVTGGYSRRIMDLKMGDVYSLLWASLELAMKTGIVAHESGKESLPEEP
jgi:hypothetical protein